MINDEPLRLRTSEEITATPAPQLSADTQKQIDELFEQLGEQQRRFVEEYVIDANCVRAAKKAGYSQKSAHIAGYRLLKNEIVIKCIELINKERRIQSRLRAEHVIEELARIAFADVRQVGKWTHESFEYFDSDEIDDDASRAIAEISHVETKNGAKSKTVKKIKMHDKLRALELLARHLKLFDDLDQVSQNALAQAAHMIAAGKISMDSVVGYLDRKNGG